MTWRARFDACLDSVLSQLCLTNKRGSIHRYYLRRIPKSGRWGLFVHHIVASDDVGVFHNHPFDGFALIFGHYTEETPDGRLREVWFFNRIGSRRSHRIEIPKGRTVWTLFLRFRKQHGGEWWYHDKNGVRIGATTPWSGPEGAGSRT